jgi:fucose 4-O-acetylase-like acetyltransferase
MCIYFTSLKHPSKPVTLVILAFWFLALVVIDALHCSVVKEAYSLASSLRRIF